MTMPTFSAADQPEVASRVYAVACPECGWETDVVGGRVMPDHNECVMTVRGVQAGNQHCPGSGTEGERVA